MSLIRGKKGFMITLLALLLTSFLAIMFSANLTNLPDYKTSLVSNRILLLNYYTESFFDYAESVGVISGYAALQGVLQDMEDTGSYNSGFLTQYPLCVVEGNLTASKACPGMTDRSLRAYLTNLSDSTMAELKVNSTFILNNLTVSQDDDPFSVDLHLNLTLYLVDAFATINATRELVVQVPVIGLRDPLSARLGTYNQTIRKTNISKKETGPWNVSDFEQLYTRHEYRATKDGVSFINRIMGNITNSSLGIESFVNHTHPGVAAVLASNPNRSITDYYFWNATVFDCAARDPYEILYVDPADLPSVPASLPLDTNHWAKFNFTSAGVTPTC